MRRKAREYAVQILYSLDLNPVPPKEALRLFWEQNPAKPETVAYATRLVEGTLENKKRIDALLSKHSSHWKVDRMPVTDRNILRLGTFELITEDGVPPRVALNEAIELAKKFGTTDSSTFVNGVLDGILQETKNVKSLS